ncbi:MAG TPA: B12-binding domain-containing radical SAM protein, partial [Xanthobacteraceae bacterium]|nr:B12-binding domain-containing radical SAM protein [Xanthobacteraceae bacterium]
MKKLLFVIPPYFNAADYLDKTRAAVLPAFTIPYGILSMEAYLRAQCARLEDLRLLDLNVTLKRLVEERAVDGYE